MFVICLIIYIGCNIIKKNCDIMSIDYKFEFIFDNFMMILM